MFGIIFVLSLVIPMEKMTPVNAKIEPVLKVHLEKEAKKADVPYSAYVRACLKKASGFKEKPIV